MRRILPTHPGQHVAGADLTFHPRYRVLQIGVSGVVSVEVVHLLELVQIDIDQPKDPHSARSVNLPVQNLSSEKRLWMSVSKSNSERWRRSV